MTVLDPVEVLVAQPNATPQWIAGFVTSMFNRRISVRTIDGRFFPRCHKDHVRKPQLQETFR